MSTHDSRKPGPEPPAAERTQDWRLAAALVLVVVALAGGFVFWVTDVLRDSPAYAAGRSFVAGHERIRGLAGTGLDFSSFPEGRLEEDRARFSYEVEGSAGSVEVVVELRRRGGEWIPVAAAYETPSGESGRLSVPGGEGGS